MLYYIEAETCMEASRGEGHKRVHCKRDRLWIRFPFEEMKYTACLQKTAKMENGVSKC